MEISTQNKEVNVKEFRDKLIYIKADQEKNKEIIEKMCVRVRKFIDSFSEEELTSLRTQGIDIDSVINLDYEKAKVDMEYYISYKENLLNVILECKALLGV